MEVVAQAVRPPSKARGGRYRNIARLTNIWYKLPMAVKTTSVALGEKLTEYMRRKVESGEFGSASEVIRDALRRAEERDMKRQALEVALREGLESPIVENFAWDEFMERHFGDAAGA